MNAELTEVKLASQETFDEAVADFQRMQSRQNNIIVSGLREKEDGSVAERVEHDLEKFSEILAELKLSGVDVLSARRVGKERLDGKRLLKVELKSSSDKLEVLKQAKYLKRGRFSGIYLNQDKTPLQRRKYGLLRSELKMRRERGEEVGGYFPR